MDHTEIRIFGVEIDMTRRPIFIIGFILLAAVSERALAACNGLSTLTGGQVASLVPGNYTCVGTFPNATWNEQLVGSTSGVVTDYKLGPASATDPTKQVGTYTITGADIGILTYNYGGGGTYTYIISGSGSPYNFCQTTGTTPNGTVFTVNVQPNHC